MPTGPLSGIRVIEMAGIGPVPFAAMMLADMGAEIIRVDRIESVRASADEAARGYLRGRRSIAVDLTQPAGVEVVRGLIGTADVLLEGFRPGVMERRGLGPDDCLTRHPSLVYGRMTGWGQDGPLALTAGHDINYVAIAGVLAHVGPAAAPVPPLNLIGDYGGGSMFLLVGVLAALLTVRGGGPGQVIDAAMTDGAAMLMTPVIDSYRRGAWTEDREANLTDGGAPFYTVYPTSDGRHLAVGAIEPQFYAEFVGGLGLSIDELPAQHDKASWPLLRARFTAVIRTRTMAEWTATFAGRDACVSPVLTMAEAPDHPHNQSRGTFAEAVGFTAMPAPAPRFSATPTPSAAAGRYIAGDSTVALLTDLGFDATARGQLMADVVVATS
jgi:alpha-methylacyl-CoA racemase